MSEVDVRRCPLCGGDNECAMAACPDAEACGDCWCAAATVPAALLARVPDAARNRACLCRRCVADALSGGRG